MAEPWDELKEKEMRRMRRRAISYSLNEAGLLIARIREQREWSMAELAKEVGVSERFLYYFKTASTRAKGHIGRASFPLFLKLKKLLEVPAPPKPVKKVEVHAYIAEDVTPKFFQNVGKYLPNLMKGTVPNRKLQGEPVQLTLDDFKHFDSKREEITANFADWLVDKAEAMLQKAYSSSKPLKGKNLVKLKMDDGSDIIEKETVYGIIDELNTVSETYQQQIFDVSSKKTKRLDDFEDEIHRTALELKDFFREWGNWGDEHYEGEYRTYETIYLRDLGFSPEEIERYRIVRGKKK